MAAQVSELERNVDHRQGNRGSKEGQRGTKMALRVHLGDALFV